MHAKSMISLAWVLAAASPALGQVHVGLTGFGTAGSEQSDDGTFRVRWNASKFPWITDAASCRAAWASRVVDDTPGWSGLLMQDSPGGLKSVRAKTCAEWQNGKAGGLSPEENCDVIEETKFVFADGLLSALAVGAPAVQSRFTDVNLEELAKALFPMRGDREENPQATKGSPRRRITGNVIRLESDETFEWIEPLAFGDFDGDGWEDMLATWGAGSMRGSDRAYGVRAFTIGDLEELVEITCRLPRMMPTSRAWEAARTALLASYGLPVGRRIELRGTCRCDGTPHGLEIDVESNRGILSGDARCDLRRDSARIKGSLGVDRGQMIRCESHGIPATSYQFDWRLTGGVLFVNGTATARDHDEASDFDAEAPVASISERLLQEGCQSEVHFRVGESRMSLRRACGSRFKEPSTDVLCVEADGRMVEVARFDRIEWGDSNREPEGDPATDAELETRMPGSLMQVDGGGQVALFDAWTYGASTSNPYVIAIPVSDGKLAIGGLRVFSSSSVSVTDGVARVHEHDLRAGADPYAEAPQRPDVVWRWAGRGWRQIGKSEAR
jgi:hypothetical protein